MRLTIKGGLQSRAANNRVNTVLHKTTLLPIIRLQNKAVRAIMYHKTKTYILYAKYRISKILNLCELSVAKIYVVF